MAPKDRPLVPEAWGDRIEAILGVLPRVICEPAWFRTRWRVQGPTIANVFGGEDQLFRIPFAASPRR